MTEPYQTLYETNQRLIMHEPLDNDERRRITDLLLAYVSDTQTAARFHKSVGAPEYVNRSTSSASADHRHMYPLFFIPPYNEGRKHRLVTGELPGTHILSANHYELEILRLLALWRRDDPAVSAMLAQTLERLDTTCFAHYCDRGECVGAGVAVLRFLTAAAPEKRACIDRLLHPLGALFADTTRGGFPHNLPVYYFLLALADFEDDYTVRLIRTRENDLTALLHRNHPTAKAQPLTTAASYSPLRRRVLEDTLSRLPAYAYLQNTQEQLPGMCMEA